MRLLAAIALLALSACDDGQPVPTAAENRDLDRAANLLDEAPNALDEVDANALEANAT